MSTLFLSTSSTDPSAHDLGYFNCNPQDPELHAKLRNLPAICLYDLLYGRQVKSPEIIANHMYASLPRFVSEAAVTQLNCDHPLTAADILGQEYRPESLAKFDADFDRPWRIYHLSVRPGILRMELTRVLDDNGLPILEPRHSDYASLSLEGIEALHIAFCALSINETAEIVEFHFGHTGSKRSVETSSQVMTRWASERHYQAIAKAAQKFQ